MVDISSILWPLAVVAVAAAAAVVASRWLATRERWLLRAEERDERERGAVATLARRVDANESALKQFIANAPRR